MSIALLRRRLLLPFVIAFVAACSDSTTEPPAPVTISISPTSATLNGGATQTFTVTVSRGTVTWSASCGNLSGEGTSRTYTAPATGGPCTVTVTSDAEATRSASATVTITAVSVAVSPATVTVDAGATQQFTATVNNAGNTAVTWTASAGTIVANGNTATLTAPATGGNVTVTATSVADATKSGTATVTVNSASVAVSPSAQAVFRGEPVSLSATVTGAADNSVTWTASCGTVTGNGSTVTWTAPNAAGPCTVTAASTLDPGKTGVATLTVRPDWRVAATNDVDDGECTFTHCSLREALNAANANPSVDTIRLVAAAAGARRGGLASQAMMMNGTLLTLASALPTITTPIHILGPGKALLTIDANASPGNTRRIFTISGDIAVSVRGMTLTGGVTNASNGGAITILGGANVVMSDLLITGNASDASEAGGVFVGESSVASMTDVEIVDNMVSGTNIPGGGLSVVNGADVTMSGGRIANNTVAEGWGGGVRTLNAKLTMTNMEVSGNKTLAGSAGGGGILAQGADGEATVSLENVTLSNNTTTGGGGGLRLLGVSQATIANSTISNNTAQEGGGMDAGNGPITMSGTTISDNTATTRGGGLLLWGSTALAVTDGTFSGNTVQNGQGGAFYLMQSSSATLTNSTVSNNTSQNGSGGAFHLTGTPSVTLTDSEITGNRTRGTDLGYHGGGVNAGPNTSFAMTGGEIAENSTENGAGGAILGFNATVMLTNVTVRDNAIGGVFGGGGILLIGGSLTASGGVIRDNMAPQGGGGGVHVENSTLAMENTQIVGNSSFVGGGISTLEAGSLTLNNVSITQNVATNSAGGLAVRGSNTAVITGGEISSNRAEGGAPGDNDFGGGVWKNSTGTFVMEGTRVADNVAASQGGGMHLLGTGAVTLRRVTVSGNTAANGGGGVTLGQNTALIENSTFSGNTSTGATSVGGGIFSATTANTTIRNSTFSGNNGGLGAGIGVTGVITINNSTFVGNIATGAGGGLGVNNPTGALNASIRNSLFANNAHPGDGGNCGIGLNGGTINSAGNNLSSDTCASFVGPNDKNNTAPGVNTTLANNGGPTFTHALLEGSAAINAGNAGTCITTDQRGAARVGVCDIGAFEFGGTAAAAGMRATPRVSRAPTVRPVSNGPPTWGRNDLSASQIMK